MGFHSQFAVARCRLAHNVAGGASFDSIIGRAENHKDRLRCERVGEEQFCVYPHELSSTRPGSLLTCIFRNAAGRISFTSTSPLMFSPAHKASGAEMSSRSFSMSASIILSRRESVCITDAAPSPKPRLHVLPAELGANTPQGGVKSVNPNSCASATE